MMVTAESKIVGVSVDVADDGTEETVAQKKAVVPLVFLLLFREGKFRIRTAGFGFGFLRRAGHLGKVSPDDFLNVGGKFGIDFLELLHRHLAVLVGVGLGDVGEDSFLGGGRDFRGCGAREECDQCGD